MIGVLAVCYALEFENIEQEKSVQLHIKYIASSFGNDLMLTFEIICGI